MNPAHILLIEDNEGDIMLTKEALSNKKILLKISVAKDGEAGILFLESCLVSNTEELPNLILLDINLPKKNGYEVLEFIKMHPLLKSIPVIILSTSSSGTDVNKAYLNHANAFISKPVEVDDFISAVSNIEDFWITLVHLPEKIKHYGKG